MALTGSVRIEKTMPFKGGIRTWGNRYHFTGGIPADATHWHTLMDAIVAAEKLTMLTTGTIVEAIGYGPTSDVPIASKTYATAGTYTQLGACAPGEVAYVVRYTTAAVSTKNHPIYCFNYYHHIDIVGTSANCDNIEGNQRTLFNTYAAAWISGFTDGVVTVTRCSPAGHNATGYYTDNYVTHRDFPYTSSV